MRDHWSESDDPRRIQRGFAATAALWTIGVIVFFGLISIAIWYFGVATSDVKGRGDQVQHRNSEVNRTFQQQHFEDLFADYTSTVQKLPTYRKAAAAGDQAASTNLTGLTSHCLDVANQYNQDSAKVLAGDFKTADLPVTLDANACQGS